MKKLLILLIAMMVLVFPACDGELSDAPNAIETTIGDTVQPTDSLAAKQPPTPLPQGILVTEISPSADIIFSSIRYVLDEGVCLDDDYNLKDRFIHDPECNRRIYDSAGGLSAPRQLFTLDIETAEAVQLTNTDCFFVNGQVIDSTTIMASAICTDTNRDGKINEQDDPNLYLIDLPTGGMRCLTCDLGLRAINNPDYSPVSKKIVFSAQRETVFHNYLFTIDVAGNLEQITSDADYMDFDCAWSEDAAMIVFNRLPAPWFEHPAQIWLMDAEGGNKVKMTDGGDNPNNEGPHRRYPIGTDADADLSPDNTRIVFSRLRTGAENEPIGVWELIVIDVETKQETVLDSSYANMVPEWKSGGIIFTRQIGGTDPMKVSQGLMRYRDGVFEKLETFPFDVFPLGAFGGSWIDSRGITIPSDAVRMTPQMDDHPPILHSDEFEPPVPMPGPINTAGAEDSPFIMPDGNTFYFFFTPDVRVPVEKQVIDGVTGIYVCEATAQGWSRPERVMLQDADKLSLDGCAFVQDDVVWFCTAREGYTGLHWFTAEYRDGRWADWQQSDFPAEFEVGELHLSADGSEVYFHSARPGGKGQYDIWVMKNIDGQWQEPANIETVNSAENDGWPYVSQDGNALWFTRTYRGTPAVFRSQKTDEGWAEPELMVSQFAGEPSLDANGNLYFVHHYYRDGEMIEADIYLARKR